MTFSQYLRASATVAALALLSACRNGHDGTASVISSRSVSSPDGHWECTLEEIDNGLGMGAAAIYGEIHVHRRGAKVFTHGDKDPTSVFYIEATYPQDYLPRISWLNSRQLLIEYPDQHKPAIRTTHIEDVEITFKAYHRDELAAERR